MPNICGFKRNKVSIKCLMLPISNMLGGLQRQIILWKPDFLWINSSFKITGTVKCQSFIIFKAKKAQLPLLNSLQPKQLLFYHVKVYEGKDQVFCYPSNMHLCYSHFHCSEMSFIRRPDVLSDFSVFCLHKANIRRLLISLCLRCCMMDYIPYGFKWRSNLKILFTLDLLQVTLCLHHLTLHLQ